MLAFAMFAILTLSTGEVACFEFGVPVNPELRPEARIRHMLADYERRRDQLWDVETSEALQILLKLHDEAGEDPARLLPIIRALGALGRPQGAEPVARHLNHRRREIKLATVRSLGQMGKFSSIPLIEPFLEHQDPAFRKEAIVALGKFGTDSVIPRIEAAARGNPELQRRAEEAKRRISATKIALQTKEFMPLVEAVIETDEYEDLLAIIGFTWRPLMLVVRDQRRSHTARLRAQRLLSLGQARKAIGDMRKIVDDEREPLDIKLEAVVGLGRCRAGSAADQLIALLKHPSTALKEAAITSLGQIGKPKALVPLLDEWDEDGGVFREKILFAARRLCSVSGTRLLTERLLRGDVLPSSDIYFVDDEMLLSRQQRKDLLDSQLNGSLPEARRDAALLVAFFGGRADVERLARMHQSDEDVRNREIAGLAVKRLGSASN